MDFPNEYIPFGCEIRGFGAVNKVGKKFKEVNTSHEQGRREFARPPCCREDTASACPPVAYRISSYVKKL